MAGFSYQIVQGHGKWFDARRAYLRNRLAAPTRDLCQVMSGVVETSELAGSANSRFQWHGFPWLTPVVGSGCLEIGAHDEVSPKAARAAIEAQVEALVEAIDGSGADPDHDLAGLAGVFAEGLVADRISSEHVEPAVVGGAGGADLDKIDQVRSRVVLVAALLNRLYFLAKGLSDSPIPRWHSDAVPLSFGPGADPSVVAEVEAMKALCLRELRTMIRSEHALSASLAAGGDTAAVSEAITELMQAVLGQLSASEQVLFSHLKVMTEVAWYVIASGTSLYPGWTDVLFKLMLGDDYETEGSARPRFATLRGIGEKVAELFRQPTATSWKSWVQSASGAEWTQRQDFYRSIAEMLWAQAGVRHSQRPVQLPVASGFAVSFDLELEMALMATAAPGAAYYVVYPVQVLPESNSNQAKLCWLRARFERPLGALPAEVGKLLKPVSWDLVHERLDDGMDCPHVVHLSGCPLLPLPVSLAENRQVLETLSRSLRDGWSTFEVEKLTLEHAVTVDEYLALQQAEAELLWSIGNGRVGSDKDADGMSLALPPLMLSSSAARGGDESCPRFWLTLGVPVADPAIRSRIVTQLSLKMLLEKTQAPKARAVAEVDLDDDEESLEVDDDEELGEELPDVDEVPRRRGRGLAGAVINRRIGLEEGSILYWLGLDVVNDLAENFAADIRHYTCHLDPDAGPGEIPHEGPCPRQGGR